MWTSCQRELKKQVMHTLRNRKMIWLLPLKLRSVVTENEKKNLHIRDGLL